MTWHPSDRFFTHLAGDEPAIGEPVAQELPHACSYCGGAEFGSATDTGRGATAICTQCGGSMSSWGGQWTPELIGDPSNHPSPAVDPHSGAGGGQSYLVHPEGFDMMPAREAVFSLFEATAGERPTIVHDPEDHDVATERPKYTLRQTVQTQNGYEDQEREIEGPLYHGGRANVRPGEHLTIGRKPNSWGDDGSRSSHNYFTTEMDTAASYAQQVGRKGRIYEVEPTGDFKSDYSHNDFKTKHPLRVVREVPQHEWPEWARRASKTATHDGGTPSGKPPVDWDTVGAHYPSLYGDPEIHGDAADGADGQSIGAAANHLAHDRADDPGAENTSVYDLEFHPTRNVDPRHIDYVRHPSSDPRVAHAIEGYRTAPDKMPPLVLVHRHGVYQVAAAAYARAKPHALIAYSPHPDEPFSDGERGPYHGAEPVGHHTAMPRRQYGEVSDVAGSHVFRGVHGHDAQAAAESTRRGVPGGGDLGPGIYVAEKPWLAIQHAGGGSPDESGIVLHGQINPGAKVGHVDWAPHHVVGGQALNDWARSEGHDVLTKGWAGGRIHVVLNPSVMKWNPKNYSVDEARHLLDDTHWQKGGDGTYTPPSKKEYPNLHQAFSVFEAALQVEAEGEEQDYRMQHQAPDSDYGAPLHDVEKVMPDFYKHPHYYNFGEEDWHTSVNKVQKARGNPDHPVRIYRALPTERADHGFNPGDWVTTSEHYAHQHGAGENNWSVMTSIVPAKHLHTEGNSIHEWAYNGPHQKADRPHQKADRPHQKTGGAVNVASVDWCTYRHMASCYWPGDNPVPGTTPQRRGACNWQTAWQQQLCPMSDPGPLAGMFVKGSKESELLDVKDAGFKGFIEKYPGDFQLSDEMDRRVRARQRERYDGAPPDHHFPDKQPEPVGTHRELANFKMGYQTDRDFWQKHGQVEDVDLHHGVYATQPYLAREHLKRYIDNPHDMGATQQANYGSQADWLQSYPGTHMPMFVRHQGNIFTTEGHHRVGAALARGESTIRGMVYDADRHGFQNPYDEEEDIQGFRKNSILSGGECHYDHDDADAAWSHALYNHDDGICVATEANRTPRRTAAWAETIAVEAGERDPEVRLQLTATWADVRNKAKRIRREGGVRILMASSEGIVGEVRGDNAVYETSLTYVPGSARVGFWHCGCKWAAYAWGRSPRYRRFEGRMCSHALAMQYEASSRSAHGREIMPDVSRPGWLKQRTPVVIQHQRDKALDLTRREVPPGNMRQVFSSWEIAEGGGLPHTAIPDQELHNTVQRALDKAHEDERERHADDATYAENNEPLHKSDIPEEHRAGWTFHRNVEGAPPISNMFSELFGPQREDQHLPPVAVTHYRHPVNREPLHLDEHGNSYRRHYEWTRPDARIPEFKGWTGPHSATETLRDHPTWSQSFDEQGNRQHHMRTHEERLQRTGTDPTEPYHDVIMRRNRNLRDQGWGVVSHLVTGSTVCPECHGPVTPSALACPHCGAQLTPTDTPDAHLGAKKEAELPGVAGVVLKALDTGRILMLQRGMEDEEDPARGTWEFPGGHVEDGDLTSLHAAIREWQEEIGQQFPEGGTVVDTWTSPNGIYQAHVVVIPEERVVVMHEGRVIPNPDDPKGDYAEQAAWWTVDHARKNPALRPEVKANTPWAKIDRAGENWKEARLTGTQDLKLTFEPGFAEDSWWPLTAGSNAGSPLLDTGLITGIPIDAPAHSNSANPASSGFATSEDPEDWAEPRSTREDLRIGASWQPDEGFDAWRARLSKGLLENGTPHPPHDRLYRSVSDDEMHAARQHGAFHSLDGKGLFVSDDPDRMAGGAYGGKAGGHIVEVDPAKVNVGSRPSYYNRRLVEKAVDHIPMDAVTRTWTWNDEAKDHLPSDAHRTATLHDEPEPALPSTDGEREASLPSGTPAPASDAGTLRHGYDDLAEFGEDHPELGTTASIIDQFQRTAGAQSLAGGNPREDQMDIAVAARLHLEKAVGVGMQKAALKDFSFQEQQQLINEGVHGITARNLPDLQIDGTHYSALEAALQEKEASGEDVSDIFVL
jgi:8-oxo-dGTP pyrophosphatase MutT (NUDIX family)